METISKFKNKKDNYDDRITNQACEQLYYAANYDALSSKYDIKEEKSSEIFKTQLFKKKRRSIGETKFMIVSHYKYASKKSKKPRGYKYAPDSLGVIICDISYLNEVIEIVSEGLNKLGSELEKIITEKSYLIGYELLFNPEIIDPNDYFDYVSTL